MQKVNLNDVPIDTLAKALLLREGEFFGERNRLISSIFELYKAMGPVSCIDGIVWRLNKAKKVELMAIRRQTGPYPGKLVLVGGTVFKGEELSEALQRHFRDDFGVEIEMSEAPFCMTQYKKSKSGKHWMQDPGKEHVISPVYFVQIKGKAPHQSLQEDPVEWFSEDLMPADEEFGYTNQRVYHGAFQKIATTFK